jgi:hypothetical protein
VTVLGAWFHVTKLAEDLQEAENRVELDPIAKDTNATPAPRVVFGFSKNTREILGASGATENARPPLYRSFVLFSA